jgi:hypothetical protein
VLLVWSAPLSAQAAATIPASSGVYDRLESVSAWFPARGVFLGERPLSRREVERILKALSVAIDSARAQPRRTAWARRQLELVDAALTDRRDVARGERGIVGVSWRADALRSSAEFVRIDSNGLGSIDAVSHPFTPGRHGWPAVKGTVTTLAPTVVLATQLRVAVAAQPTASLASMRHGGWTSERFFHRAYARAAVRNVALHVGAEERRWGQSPFGSLFLSGNAQPLPEIAIATDTAITLPWLFRHVGPARGILFLANLGEAQVPRRARLAGWQASIQPWTRFELGVAVLTHTGGAGGPPATFLERVVDLFPVIDALAPQHSDLQISNKLAGGNLRLRFPELSGLDFYYELQIDDFDGRRLRSSMVDDAAHLLGLRLPLLVRNGQLTSRAEWHRTSLRLYEHGQFRSGMTYHERLIGSPLGPHAVAGYLSTTWRWAPLNAVDATIADERRDPSQYGVVTTGPRDEGFRFIRQSDDPDVRRRRATVSLEHGLPLGALRFTLGYNRAWRTGQEARNEWLGLVSITSRRLTAF